MRIDEIAKRAKVSRSTVSRVINNGPGVRDETREAVERVIRELNYVPNAAARSLAGRRAGVVGVLIQNIIQPFWGGVFAGIESQMVGMGYGVLLSNFQNAQNAQHYAGNHCLSLRALLTQNVDGVIVALYDDLAEEDAALIRSSGKPFVVIQSSVCGAGFSTVNVDNVAVTRQAAERLIELGHTDLCHAMGRPGSRIASDRLTGFVTAMREHGLPVSDDHLISCGSLFDDGYWCMSRILGMKKRPTGVVFPNDLTAYGAMLKAREVGVRIPEDISVIGVDHLSALIDVAAMLPDLASVALPVAEHGAAAARLLAEQIEHGAPPRDVILPCRLHEGATMRAL